MTATPTTRMAAEERRVEILEAAREEFALRGLHGASTDAIARRAGISQPYLFRLFGTKKELYLATARQCLADTLRVFEDAAEDKSGEEALDAIGHAYGEIVRENPTILLAQMQAYAACSDPEVCAVVREGYGRLVEHAERVSGADPARIATFFGGGMLLNVVAAMGLVGADEGWAQRLLEGCKRSDRQA